MSTSLVPNQIQIDLCERSYPIWIGTQLIDNPNTWADLPKAAMALVVTNETVGPLYAKRLCAALKSHYGQVMTLVMPDGESHKNWQTLTLSHHLYNIDSSM